MAQNSSAIAAAVAQSDRGGLASIGRRGGTRPRSAGQTDMFSMLGLAPAPAQVGASAMPVPEPEPAAPPAPPPPATAIAAVMASPDFRLRGERKLAADWKSRARDNVDAIQLSAEIEAEGRPATEEEQARLSLFTGFGASDLATSVFRDAATKEFRAGWESLGQMVETAVRPDEMDSLARSIQFAHYTPEVIVEAMWSAVTRLGFAGGRVLDAGFGTGMFKAMQPEALDGATRYTGVEADVVTARIARLLHPGADVFRDEFENVGLRRHYNLAIGNPPYANLVVRKDADYRSLSLMLHDYFIVKSLDALRPGGLAAFVTSRGTMDKGNASARARMAEVADLVAAFRLPDGAFQAKAGTDAGTDVLIFRRRLEGEAPSGPAWLHTVEWNGARTAYGHELVDVNEYWPSHREHVLGQARAGRSRFGKNVVRVEAHRHEDLAASLARVVADLPEGLVALSCAPDDLEPERREVARGKAADGFTIREGSYFVETATDRLMQVVDGREVAVPLKSKASPGMASTHARIVRALVGVRDLVREILRLQDAGDDSSEAQRQLGLAYDAFAKAHGPINRTVCHVTRVPGEDGAEEERRSYRYPNLSPFRDDPDVWLVASIERYDAETDTAERSAIFTGIVVRPPGEARITSASDALAVTLSTKGRVDVAHIASLLGTDTASVRDALAGELFLDPVTGDLQTADQYLSGAVRLKLEQARRHAAADPSFDVNVAALERVQPADLPPSDITAQLGAPWIPGSVVEDFAREVMGATTVGVTHAASVGTWVVSSWFLESDYAARIRWGGGGRSALNTISDALNNVSPQVTMRGPDGKSEVVDPVATEQARAKIQEAKEAFTDWVWTDPDRTDDLVLRYNTIHNDTVPRTFDGSHMTIEGASPAFAFYDKQKTAVWRIVSAGSTYVAHAVGAGKTATIAAAIMEQRRLGLVNKALLTVPGHCLAQVAGQFLALYPKAKILVADEQNFARENRRRFLARAATGHWDCIVITHSALKFIPVPTDFEEKFLSREIARYVEALGVIRNSRDRGATRRLEAAKQRLEQRLAALTTEKDDFLSLVDIGVDQIVVDEAHEFRKLSFNTQNNFLKGVDPNGSMMSWDLFTKAGCLREIRADAGRGRRDFVDRALVMASGTPLTNTVGEMFTVQRFMDMEALERRQVHNFDAWSATFGTCKTALELQPSGRYKPVTRFAEFVNIPELLSMFRAFADVVTSEDLARYVRRPAIRGGGREIVTAAQSEAFKAYQRDLALRIDAIENRTGAPKPGDDIILSVISDGRHAAMDMRLVDPAADDEPGNKLNLMIDDMIATYRETADNVYLDASGRPMERRGAAQIMFSDLGTPAAREKRGFSVYHWVRDRLVAAGVPRSEIAFIQDYDRAEEKARLFADVNAGVVRFLLGSSQKLGTGANVQLRLKALLHLDVPWLPSQIEQREGRIERQGNQNEEIVIRAYATLGSMDATMWQSNERKKRFMSAALSGDRSVRRLEDIGDAADQFAMAKAIASGDPRLMQKAGLESDVARLSRLLMAHHDGQSRARREVRAIVERRERMVAEIAALDGDVARREPRADDTPVLVEGRPHLDEAALGKALHRRMRLLNATRSGVAQPLASYRGLGVSFRSETDETSHASWVELGGRRRHHVRIALNGSHADARAAIVGAIDNLEGLQRSYREQIARDEAEERRLRPLIGTPFPYQDDLDHKTASLREVNDELEAEGRAAAATASAAFAKAGGAGASASAPPDGDEDEDDGEAEEFEGDLEAAVDGCDDADAGSAAYAGERMAA